VEVLVEGMTCEHCVRAVTAAVSALPGVGGVTVDLTAGRVRVEGAPDAAAVKAAIEEEGYTVK
jgi:copper chaperone